MKIAIGKRNLDERLEETAEDPWLSRSTFTRKVQIRSSFPDGRKLLIELEREDARSLGQSLLRMTEDDEEAGGGPAKAQAAVSHPIGCRAPSGVSLTARSINDVRPCRS